MSLFGSKSNSQTQITYTGLQLQSSAAGVAMPMIYGQNQGTINALWVNDFQKHNADKGGKGGGKSTNYTYTAAVILGICEGTINGVPQTVSNGTTTSLGALNLYLETGTGTQTPESWIEAHFPSEALAYPWLAYIFSEQLQLGSSASLPSLSLTINGLLWSSDGVGTPDVNFADVLYDIATDTHHGLDQPSSIFDTTTLALYKTYTAAQGIFGSPALISPEQGTSIIQRWAQLTNTWIFWNGLCIKFRPLGSQNLSANGSTYTANNSSVLTVGLNDYIFNPDSNEDPVTYTRIDPSDGYNLVEIDFADRSNNFNTSPVYYRDLDSINKYGVLQSLTINATEICVASIASICVSLLGQRTINIRNNYSLTLGQWAIFLEVGDIITLNEPNQGWVNLDVLITAIEEDENFNLKITAEEYPEGTGVPASLDIQSNANSGDPGYLASPGSINTPFIMQPNIALTQGSNELWIGASGSVSAWGGCQVWASTDTTSYVQVGTVNAPTVQGTLTGSISTTATSLSVDTTISDGGVIPNATSNSASLAQTIVAIDDEILAWGTTTLTGTNTYTLSGVERAEYYTTAGTHASGAELSVIVPANLLQLELPPQYAGQTVYFKFLSFNLYGNELQTLADVDAYTFTPEALPTQVVPGLVPAITATALINSILVTWEQPSITSTAGLPTGTTIFKCLASSVGSTTVSVTTDQVPYPGDSWLDAAVSTSETYAYFAVPYNAVGAADSIGGTSSSRPHLPLLSLEATATPTSSSGTPGTGTVYSISTGGGIQGGPITTSGTIQLATISNNTILGNVSGTTAIPSSTTPTALLDSIFGTTVGTLLQRGATTWQALTPGTSGYVLTSNGAGTICSWQAAPSGEGITSITIGTGLTSTSGTVITSTGTMSLAAVPSGKLLGNTTGSSAAPLPVTMSAMLDAGLGSAPGSVIWRSGAGWTTIAVGSLGQVLTVGSSGVIGWGTPGASVTVTNEGGGDAAVYDTTASSAGSIVLRTLQGLNGITVYQTTTGVIQISLTGPAITTDSGTILTVSGGRTLTVG